MTLEAILIATTNASTVYDHGTWIHKRNVVLGAVYLVTGLLVMASNGVVVMVVVCSWRNRPLPLWNLAFMALCDFINGLYNVLVVVPAAFMDEFPFPESCITPAMFLSSLLYGQNLLNIVTAILERFISVCWPLRYPKLVTQSNFIVFIAFTVILNVTRSCLIIFPEVDTYYHVDLYLVTIGFNNLKSVIAAVGLPVACAFIIAGVVLKILYEIFHSRRQIKPSGQHRPSAVQFTVTITVSAVVFCLSFVPTCVAIIWNLLHGKDRVPLAFIHTCVFLSMMNSLWNVVIYCTTYRPFREAFLRLVCKAYFRRRRQISVQTIYLHQREGVKRVSN